MADPTRFPWRLSAALVATIIAGNLLFGAIGWAVERWAGY